MGIMRDQIEAIVNPDGTIPPVDWDRQLMIALGDERELRRMDRRDKAPYLRLVITSPSKSVLASPPIGAGCGGDGQA